METAFDMFYKTEVPEDELIVSHEKATEMQDLYDKLRSEEEGTTRIVLYINNDKLEAAQALEE